MFSLLLELSNKDKPKQQGQQKCITFISVLKRKAKKEQQVRFDPSVECAL